MNNEKILFIAIMILLLIGTGSEWYVGRYELYDMGFGLMCILDFMFLMFSIIYWVIDLKIKLRGVEN